MVRRIDRDARKAQLAEAVWQVILERGISAVSIRTVADQAGVVTGSLRHIFPTRSELLIFSAELMVRRVTERVVELPIGGGGRDYALAVLQELMPFDAQRRAELEINISLIAESLAEPGLTPIRNSANAQLLDVCVRLVGLLVPDDDDDRILRRARRLHALMDGVAIHMIHRPADADTAWATDLIRDELDRIVASAIGRDRRGAP